MSDAPTAVTQAPPSDVAHAPMPPARRPSRRRGRSAAAMVLQVALIAVGVFLGLAGEEWREDRENRRLAIETLRRFSTEIATNRDAVLRVRDYHAERHAELSAYFAATDQEKETIDVSLVEGILPPTFESTAWNLALATGALTYLDPDLAFELSRVYGMQQMTNELGSGVIQAMYLKPPTDPGDGFLSIVKLYYDDLSAFEPALLENYESLLVALDEALAE